MTSFLFWNLHKKALYARLAAIADRDMIDVVAVAESPDESPKVLRYLNARSTSYFDVTNLTKRISIFTRQPAQFFVPVHDDPHYTVRRLIRPGGENVTVVIVHLLSKLYQSQSSQTADAYVVADEIRTIEIREGHSRTVVVGDFNMNPFEDGLVSAKGFHAVPSRAVASRATRTVSRRKYPFFFNPMWNRFGDEFGVPGTIYYSGSEYLVHFWGMFDQVLVRPELLGKFHTASAKILESDGTNSLLRNGKPDTTKGSDHLPIYFELDL